MPVLVLVLATALGACGDDPAPVAPLGGAAPAVRPAPTPPPERTRHHVGQESTPLPAPSADEPPAATLGVVSGCVVTADDRQVADFPVYLLPVTEDGSLPLAEARTDAVGAFSFAGVPVASGRVVASGEFGGDAKTATKAFDRGEGDATGLVLRIGAPAGIAFDARVVWDDDLPVAQFDVMLERMDGEMESLRLVGEDGACRGVAPAPGKFWIARVVADGEEIDGVRDRVQVTDGATVTIRLPRERSARLRVVDADTGGALSTARAYEYVPDRNGWFESGPHIPNARTQAGAAFWADAAGVIDLGRARGQTLVYVIADGHEWMAVQAAHTDGEPVVIALRPAGVLEVGIPGWNRLEAAQVDVRLEDGSHHELPARDADGSIRVVGVRLGKALVTVRRGNWFEDGVVYGTAEVDVVAGAVARVTIDVDAGEPVVKARLTVTIRVPSAWGELPRSLHYEGADETNTHIDEYHRLRSPVSGRAVEFAIGDIPVGNYRLEVDPFQFRRLVELKVGGTHVELDLGEPARVLVHVVSDETGAPLPGASVGWYTLLPGQHGWSPDEATRGDDGVFEILAPAGTVQVDASAEGHVDGNAGVEAHAGQTSDVTIRLAPGGVLAVRLVVDGKPFTALAPSVGIEPVHRDDETSWWSRSTSTSGGRADFDGLPAGRYHVTVADEMPGYTAQPVDVDVAAGARVEVELHVERAR